MPYLYMCYDYVHLDNLSDMSAYRTVVKPQHKAMQNANPVKDTYGLKSCSGELNIKYGKLNIKSDI